MSKLNDGRWRRKPPDLTGTGIRPRARRDKTGTYHVFEVRWTDPLTGKKLSEQLPTPQEALDFKAHLRLLRRRDVLGDLDRGRETLDTFAGQWLEQHAALNLTTRTLAAYAATYDLHVSPRIGHLELRALKPRVLDQLRRGMKEDGAGDPTIRKALAILSSMLSQAVAWERIDANPVLSVRKPSGRRRKIITPLTVLQIERLIYWARKLDSHRSALLVELLAYSGARPQDALALGHDRVGARIHYACKNIDGRILPGAKTGDDQTRSVEAFKVLRSDLLAHRALTPGATNTSLVIARDDGQPWRDHDYKNWTARAARGTRRIRDHQRTGQPGAFARAREAAGLPGDVTPYFLRHTYASLRIAEQRLSLQEIAVELGHSVEVLADHYAHVISEYAGQGPIDPNKLIAKARKQVSAGDVFEHAGRQTDAKPTAEGGR